MEEVGVRKIFSMYKCRSLNSQRKAFKNTYIHPRFVFFIARLKDQPYRMSTIKTWTNSQQLVSCKMIHTCAENRINHINKTVLTPFILSYIMTKLQNNVSFAITSTNYTTSRYLLPSDEIIVVYNVSLTIKR